MGCILVVFLTLWAENSSSYKFEQELTLQNSVYTLNHGYHEILLQNSQHLLIALNSNMGHIFSRT